VLTRPSSKEIPRSSMLRSFFAGSKVIFTALIVATNRQSAKPNFAALCIFALIGVGAAGHLHRRIGGACRGMLAGKTSDEQVPRAEGIAG
jgi:hypothetical protein